MVNFEGAQTRECMAKIADARPNIELLIAFVVLDLTRSSVAATWFCSAATVETSHYALRGF
jgi:hypothetical protein